MIVCMHVVGYLFYVVVQSVHTEFVSTLQAMGGAMLVYNAVR